MLNKLIHSTIGFAWGIRISGFFIAACFLVGNGLIRVPPSPNKTQGAVKKTGGKTIDRPFGLILIAAFIGQLGLYFPLFYAQLLARENGISENLAFYSLAIINGAGIVGRILPNRLSHYVGVINMSLISGICAGMSKACLYLYCLHLRSQDSL